MCQKFLFSKYLFLLFKEYLKVFVFKNVISTFLKSLKVLVLKHVRVRGETLSPKLNQLPRQFLITLISQIVTKKEAKDQIFLGRKIHKKIVFVAFWWKCCWQSKKGLCLTWISDGGVGLPQIAAEARNQNWAVDSKIWQRFQNFGGVSKLWSWSIILQSFF